MVYETLYVISGAGLLVFSSRVKEDSPSWIMNIWGLVLILAGIGFFRDFVQTYSLLPFFMMCGIITSRVAGGWMKPILFLSSIFLFVFPALSYGDMFFSSLRYILIAVIVLGGVYVVAGGARAESPRTQLGPSKIKNKPIKEKLPKPESKNPAVYDLPSSWDDP